MMEQQPTSFRSKPDYGIDAPGLVRFFFLSGGFLLLGACLAAWLPAGRTALQFWVGLGLGLVSLYLLGMGSLMLYWSKVTKLKTRDVVLDRIGWRGDERVLDIGCGRGLMLVGAARRLTTGKATGIDIWQSKDQSGNTPEAAWANARKEGVVDRVDIATGDMRDLAYPQQSFDIVVSHWVVHNLASQAERDRALEEMARVLRPGGQLILADIENRESYTAKLEALGFLHIRILVDPVKDKILRALSFGSFGPATHYAEKPL